MLRAVIILIQERLFCSEVSDLHLLDDAKSEENREFFPSNITQQYPQRLLS